MGNIIRRGTRQAPRFYLQYRDADGVRRTNVAKGATTLDEAKQLLAATELRVSQGQRGVEAPTEEQKAQQAITLARLVAHFNGDVDGDPGYAPPKLKDVAEYRKQSRSVFNVRILPVLGRRAAASITSLDIERLRDALLAPVPKVRDGYAPRSVEWTLARISKVYVWGRKVGLVSCQSPVAGVDYPKGEGSLDFLSKLEVAQLLDYAERERPDIHPMIAAAVYAGLRKGELYGLRWCDVNLDRVQLTVARSYTLAPKSGKPRHLPMHPELVRILREWRKRCPKTDEDLVFPVGDVALGWRMGKKSEMLGLAVVLKLAGCHVLQPKAWHGLRHTFASHFMMAGGSILTLQKLLGHADLTMTLIYAHLAPDFMAAELAKMTYAMPLASVADMAAARAAKIGVVSDEQS